VGDSATSDREIGQREIGKLKIDDARCPISRSSAASDAQGGLAFDPTSISAN